MKKICKIAGLAVVAAVMGTAFVSCGSTPKAGTGSSSVKQDPTLSVNVDDDIDKLTVIDWTDRGLGEVSAPQWLKNVRRGNSDTFKEMWGTESSRVVKAVVATGKTEASAQAICRAQIGYSLANELKTKVIGRVGAGLNDTEQLEAVFLAASETKVDMAGVREEASFYQKIRITKAGSKEKKEQYQYYIVYSMDKGTWDNICKKYLMDVMGGADLTTETKKKVGSLFSEMKDDADKVDAAKKEKEDKDYKLAMAKIEAERAKNAAPVVTAKDSEQAAVDEAEDLESFLM